MELEAIRTWIDDERARQLELWGSQDHNADSEWYLIAAEEFGEIAKAILEKDEDNLEVEIIQTIAVLQAWMEAK